ncbi:right-handed parallel beta-helix repeat-containing protein [Cupriavidus oxalaticus]|uniref:right-handed parallel beta-helix repeat-containing protein n=1 Tax=Cupriavidus oxalaticus TaxID=96344 RepID=UPI001F0E38B3|nr:right-handed parallel beta-helix repeat-containing protein [Cupriavidus oxalaticus]
MATAGAAQAGYMLPLADAKASTPEPRTPEALSLLDFMPDGMREDALTGKAAMDHTAAVQAALDSGVAVLTVPGRAVFRLTAPLTVRHKIRLVGNGELRFTAGIASAAAITVRKDGCEFDGIYLTNRNRLQSQTGGRNVGICFMANLGTVTRSTIQYFQNGVQAESNGEFHDYVIADNKILDCIGAGGGHANPGDNGEDRGDGITIWGCAATIVGNLVTAMAGQDCRVGIHVEGLANYHADSFPLQDNLCTISGNVVRGPFRRSIVSEQVSNATITGNTCQGATWWGIAVIRSHSNTVVANTVLYNRARTDQSGAAWKPVYAGIMLYGGCVQCVVSGNSVDLSRGYAVTAVCLQGLASDTVAQATQASSTNGTANVAMAAANPMIQVGQIITGAGVPPSTYVVSMAGTVLVASNGIAAGKPVLSFTANDRGQGNQVTGNSLFCNATNEADGIEVLYQDCPAINSNNMRGVGKHGIYAYGTSEPVINGNTLNGQNGTGSGIYLEASGTAAVVVGNVVAGFSAPRSCGIAAFNRSGGVISGNFVRGCTTDIDLFGTTSMSVTGNSSAGCTRHYSGGNSAGMMLANNIHK